MYLKTYIILSLNIFFYNEFLELNCDLLIVISKQNIIIWVSLIIVLYGYNDLSLFLDLKYISMSFFMFLHVEFGDCTFFYFKFSI